MLVRKLLLFAFLLWASEGIVACDYCGGHDCLEARTDIPKGKGASGKWVDDVTPKRGWKCTDIEDHEDASNLCEMCEREHVRYAHIMEHGALKLEVGCICAAYMEGLLDEDGDIDIKTAKAREAIFKARTSRFVEYMNEANWKTSTKGNPYYTIKRSAHNSKSRRVILSQSKYDAAQYSYMIISKTAEDVEETIRSKGYQPKHDAMREAFNVMFPSRIADN